MTGNDPHQRHLFLATALATREQKRLALIIACFCALAFALAAPFARVQLVPLPIFIPSYEAVLVFIDVVTAVLLFEQFARLRSPGILALAAGYLFEALIIIPHALTFPGAFAPAGLLGAKPQTTAWLYTFWHGSFPFFVMAYVLLRRGEVARRPVNRVGAAVAASAFGVVVLAAAFTLAATWGHDFLPVLMQGTGYSQAVAKGVNPTTWLLTFVAMLTLWQRKQRVLDLWLMLVMWVWLLDIALSALIGASRFDLGFYVGRVFGLLASSFLLITLIVEMANMYAGAASAAFNAEQKLARLRANLTARTPRNERTEAFIQRQNIAHYRALLESGSLDPVRRRSIEKLLSEAEQSQADGGLASA